MGLIATIAQDSEADAIATTQCIDVQQGALKATIPVSKERHDHDDVE